jgi:hypothetical protein
MLLEDEVAYIHDDCCSCAFSMLWLIDYAVATADDLPLR